MVKLRWVGPLYHLTSRLTALRAFTTSNTSIYLPQYHNTGRHVGYPSAMAADLTLRNLDRIPH